MSKRLHHNIIHPAVLYFIVFVLVVLASWIGSVLEMRVVSGYSQLTLRSVLGAQGIRWIVDNAAWTLSQSPVGNAVMLFMLVGIGRESGLFASLSRLRNLSPRERTAMVIAAVSILIVLLLIIVGIVSDSRLAISVTGTFAGSPLAKGAVFLLMLAVSVPSIVYGLATGRLKSATDCVRAFASAVGEWAQFIVTMLIASQIIQTLEYTHLDALMHIGTKGMDVISFLLYWLPLPVIMLMNQKSRQ